MPRRLLVYLTALGTVSLWGASFPLTKAALDIYHIGPTSLAFLRWAISALVLAAWLVRGDGLTTARRVLAGHRRTVCWVSLSGITLFYILENAALVFTSATNAGVLSNLTSVFMVLIGALWLRERLKALEWLAMATAFAGAVLVSLGSGHLTFSGQAIWGDLLMVVAGLFAAIYSIGAKSLVGRFPAAPVTALVATAGALFLLPLALIEGLRLDLPLAAWGILLLLGLGAGALANLWWLYILSRTDASRAALLLFLIPVISTGVAVVLLDEPLTAGIVAGAILVLAGVLIIQRGQRTTTPSPAERNGRDGIREPG